MNRYLMFIFLSLIVFRIVLADNIVMKDGTLLKGTITSASKDSATIRIDVGLKIIAKSEILSFVFTNADFLIVDMEKKIVCKIANKIDNDVIIATKEGVRKLSNSIIDKVQRNIGGEITVFDLPETGPQFINQPSQSVWKGERKTNIILRLQFGVHYASLDTWKSSFVITSGQETPSTGLMYGSEIGYDFGKIIQITLGYEGFSSQKVQIDNTSPTFSTRVFYSFLYGTIRAGDFLASTPALYLYGAFDLGSLKGTVTEDYSNSTSIEGIGNTMGFRIKGGGEYFFNGNWSTTAEIGYLIGKINQITLLGQTVPQYDLNFSGLSLIVAFSYHIPLP